MSESLDERVEIATAVIEHESPTKIKPSFDAVSYYSQKSTQCETNSINSLRTNPWLELKEKRRILDCACSLVSKIAGQKVDESSLIHFLEDYVNDPNQSIRQMSRVWGEAEERIGNMKSRSEVENVKHDMQLMKKDEKIRNLTSVLIQKELKAENDKLEKTILKLKLENTNLKRNSKTNKTKKETADSESQTETLEEKSARSPATGKLLKKKDETILRLKSEIETNVMDIRRLQEDMVHYERIVDELENERKRRKRFKTRAELAEAKLEQLVNSQEFQLMQNFGNYLSSIS